MITAPMISVIIPMYNCAEYIGNCIRTLQSQSFSDFEAIIVDNGSTDDSYACAQAAIGQDRRFQMIRHAEGKAGTARNVGIAQAAGEYVAFVDGDDELQDNYLEELYRAITENQADVAVCAFTFCFRSTGKKVIGDHPPGNAVFQKTEALKELLRDRSMRFYLWNKLWRRSLFTENQITIPDMYYEDACVCPALFCKAETVVTISNAGYIYMRAFSKYKEINMSPVRLNDYINTIPIIRLCLEEDGCYKQVKGSFMSHICHVFFSIPTLVMQIRKSLKRNAVVNMVKGMGKVIRCCTMPYEKLKNSNYKDNAVC